MKKPKKIHTTFFVTAVIVLCGAVYIYGQAPYTANTSPVISKKTNSAGTAVASFDKKQFSIDQPGSTWWIVNKKRMLPNNYVPANLVTPNVILRTGNTSAEMKLDVRAAKALEGLFAAGKAAGFQFKLASAYRSQALQSQLYNGYVATQGRAQADRSSAKPGTSEHQTGLAMDICLANSSCSLEQSFGKTAAGEWVATNAAQYGLIVRYLDGKEQVTGYEYEPWHLRFVGTELAVELGKTNQTMEEFFGL